LEGHDDAVDAGSVWLPHSLKVALSLPYSTLISQTNPSGVTFHKRTLRQSEQEERGHLPEEQRRRGRLDTTPFRPPLSVIKSHTRVVHRHTSLAIHGYTRDGRLGALMGGRTWGETTTQGSGRLDTHSLRLPSSPRRLAPPLVGQTPHAAPSLFLSPSSSDSLGSLLARVLELGVPHYSVGSASCTRPAVYPRRC
jgi:hypothetical protein